MVVRRKAPHNRETAPLTIINCIDDPQIWGEWFKDRQTWGAWFTFLKVMFALPLDEAELALFRQCTGRATPLAGGYIDAALAIGRRGGKSLTLALIAAFLACFDTRPAHAQFYFVLDFILIRIDRDSHGGC
jgi:hypothetical protein